MSSVVVSTIVPSEAIISEPASTSKHILRKKQLEILPNESTLFEYNGNDTIRFNLSSSTEMLDGMDSYIKMSLLCTGNATRVLDVGGAHALFREITVMTQSGTIIQRYQHYNRWYAMMSMATHSPQHVELVEAAAGDSVSADGNIVNPYNPLVSTVSDAAALEDIKYNPAVAIFDHNNGEGFGARTFILGNGSVVPNPPFAVGDELLIAVADANDAGFGTYYATITGGLNNVDNEVRFSIGAAGVDNNVPAHALLVNEVVHISRVKRAASVVPNANNVYVSQRAAVARSAEAVPLMFKPALSFLQQKNWIPLALIKQGLQIEMKLDRPDYVLNKLQSPVAQNDAEVLSYTISQPRYVAMMITPDENLMSKYLKEFNSEGIHMSFLSYIHASKTISGGAANSQTINHLFGVRSARHVMSVCQSTRISQDVSRASRGNFSLSTFFRSAITQYQYKSGSEQFPERPISCDNFSTEAFAQLMLATGQHGGTLWNVRFSPSEWRNNNTIVSSTAANPNVNVELTNRSTKFIMATPLDRDSSSPFTGLDLSINPLDLELVFGVPEVEAFGDRVIQTFVSFDTLLSISSSGVVLRK